jgi:hypothetical protein
VIWIHTTRFNYMIVYPDGSPIIIVLWSNLWCGKKKKMYKWLLFNVTCGQYVSYINEQNTFTNNTFVNTYTFLCKCIHLTVEECPYNVCIHCPVSAFHTFSVLSVEPLITTLLKTLTTNVFLFHFYKSFTSRNTM